MAERRLEVAADRIDDDARDLGIDGEATKAKARSGELRVAALLVREAARAVSRSERPSAGPREDPTGPPLKAQA